MTFFSLIQPKLPIFLKTLDSISGPDAAKDLSELSAEVVSYIALNDDLADDTDGTQFSDTEFEIDTSYEGGFVETILDPSTAIVVSFDVDPQSPPPDIGALFSIRSPLTFTGGLNAIIVRADYTIDSTGPLESSSLYESGIYVGPSADVTLGTNAQPSVIMSDITIAQDIGFLGLNSLYIDEGSVSTGDGDDIILLSTYVMTEQASNFFYSGLQLGEEGIPAMNRSTLSTGAGADEITIAFAHETEMPRTERPDFVPNWTAMGLFSDLPTRIDTGEGDDRISISISIENGDSGLCFGINSAGDESIHMGTGNDVLSVETSLSLVPFGAGVFNYGIYLFSGATIDMGVGDDVIDVNVTTAILGGSAGGTGYGIAGDDFLKGNFIMGDGDDQLNVSVLGIGNAITRLYGADGVFFDGGAGADEVLITGDRQTVDGFGFVTGVSRSEFVLGAEDEQDDDRFIVNVISDGPTGDAYGLRGSTSISMGGGDDFVAITARASGEAIGMVESTIMLGVGADTLILRANGVGLENSEVYGGGGSDTLDLQSGTGMVDGGTGTDVLILAGTSTDFSFDGQFLTSSSGVTNLELISVELVTFDDGTFLIDDLISA